MSWFGFFRKKLTVKEKERIAYDKTLDAQMRWLSQHGKLPNREQSIKIFLENMAVLNLKYGDKK